ncbi:transposable element Tcb2 transposase [Trichonephila clavipes]|nr:transposable element Tcb2 transposase [Trichonephila clavipes]
MKRPSNRKKCTRTANCFIGCHLGTGSTSTRTHVSSRTVRRRLAEGNLVSWHTLRALTLTPTHTCLRLEWCHVRGNRTEAEWNKVVFSDKSRFNFSSDDNRVRVWKPVVNASILTLLYSDTASIMLWGAVAYNTRSLQGLMRSTMTSQRYVYDILQPHVLSFMRRILGAIFQQHNAWPHKTRVSQDCLRTVTTLLWSERSPDLSPIEHVFDHLGR